MAATKWNRGGRGDNAEVTTKEAKSAKVTMPYTAKNKGYRGQHACESGCGF